MRKNKKQHKSKETEFEKDIKPLLPILNQVRDSQTYPKTATVEEWRSLLDIHFKYVKKGRGTKECESCKKYFLICNSINNYR